MAAARFGLQILRHMELSDCIAYVNDPRSIKAESLHELACSIDSSFSLDSIVDHMSGIVQLSHTEPMFVGIHRLQEMPLPPYFFSYRDMCCSCGPLVCAAVVEMRIPKFVVVFSSVACTGQGGEKSVVDFLYEEGEFLRSQEAMPETIFPGICRVRVENLQDILARFEERSAIRIDFETEVSFLISVTEEPAIPVVEEPAESNPRDEEVEWILL